MAPALALVGAPAISACQTSQQTGAIAGGFICAGTGALVSNAVTPPHHRHCARHGFDRNGNGVCIAFYR